MSKALVNRAVEEAATGNVERAVGSLRGLDPDFVRKRLSVLAGVDDKEASAAARALWSALFPTQPLIVVRPPEKIRQAGVAPEPLPAQVRLPPRLLLENPGPLFQSISREGRSEVDLDEVEVGQMFALVALAALARPGGRGSLSVRGESGDAARFAHAVGFDDVIAGIDPKTPGEQGRTAKLRRAHRADQIETLSRDIAGLILPEDDEGKHALKYVIVELLRNAIQHSGDPLGGVVAAQRMDAGQNYPRACIQVAVADAGQGVFAALKPRHAGLASAQEALERSLWPHYSGTFDEGGTGSAENAGMGLFIISELAKLTGSRMLLASRGAALVLRADPNDVTRHDLSFLNPPGLGFPGTLVAFELPIGLVSDFDSMLEVVRERARVRTPQRQLNKWLLFEGRPAEVLPRLVNYFTAEDTIAAQIFAREQLHPLILQRKPVALDFRGLDVCTQSFLHSLLFEALRLAWALRVAIYVDNASPAVRSGLQMLENYALSG